MLFQQVNKPIQASALLAFGLLPRSMIILLRFAFLSQWFMQVGFQQCLCTAKKQESSHAKWSLVLWRQERKGRSEKEGYKNNLVLIFALALKSVVHMKGKGRLFSAISSRISSKEFTSSILCLVLDWPQSRELGQSCFWCLDTSLALFLPHPFRGLCTHGFSVAQKMVRLYWSLK